MKFNRSSRKKFSLSSFNSKRIQELLKIQTLYSVQRLIVVLSWTKETLRRKRWHALFVVSQHARNASKYSMATALARTIKASTKTGLLAWRFTSVPNVDAKWKRMEDVHTCIVRSASILGAGHADFQKIISYTVFQLVFLTSLIQVMMKAKTYALSSTITLST